MTKRSNGAVIGFYHLEILLAMLAGAVSMWIMFSITKPTQVNYLVVPNFFCVVTGLAVYAAAYYFIWKGLMGRCWGRLIENKAAAGWYVWMVFASVGAGLVFFILSVYVMIWAADAYSNWLFALYFAIMGYSVLLPVIIHIINKKAMSREEG
ncbi:MAG: hypothetical protein K6A80_11035 [Saccharofermentans sp.]|nr:hypothetical protein [Saccharofermentans sp.]